MNFKEWLLSEELKIANAPNPKLTTKAKPLDVNSIRYKKNAQQIIALGNHFKGNDNTEPKPKSPLGEFLRDKRHAFQDFEKIKIDPNHKKTAIRKWYDTDKQIGIDAGLPNDWHLFTDKYKPENKQLQDYKKTNDENIKKLGKHFKDNNNTEPYWDSDLAIFLTGKRKAFRDYTKIKINPKYKRTTGYKWYDTDELFGIDAGLPEDWHLFTGKYKPERNDFKILKQKNDQQLIALGKHFKDNNNTEPYRDSDLGKFLNDKRNAFRDSEKIKIDPKYKKTTSRKWYDTDPQVAKDAGLPEDWHLFTDKYKPEKNEDNLFKLKNNKKLKKLGKHFERFGEPMPTSNLGQFLRDKRKAFQDFKNKEDPNYTKTSGRKWYKTDEQIGIDAGLPEGWHLPNDKQSGSQGEKLVGKTLEKLKFNAIHQYRDKECDIITGRCLRFDYSFEYKDQEYFVEYHGVQHYYPVYFGSTEGMTKQEIAKHALDAFEVNQESDLQKYNYCKEKNNKFPLLVIPYWITPDRFKYLILSFIKHYNEFNEFFAKPDIPNKNKEYHKKMYEKYLADLKSTELVKQKTTFEQFLINKNFTYYNA